MGARSKRKGNAGEREFLRLLEEHGIEAQRNNQMYIGGKDNPDISARIGGSDIHFEIKRTERFRLYPALEQASRDADGRRTPIVAHRMNKKPWVVVLTLEDFMQLMGSNPEISEALKIEDFDFSDMEKSLQDMSFEKF